MQYETEIENLLNNSFLAPYLTQENVTDISFNGSKLHIQDNEKGRYLAEYQPSKDEVMQLGKRIADLQGKEFTNMNPILDTELSYYRVNFIHDSISPTGCTFSIRVSRPKLIGRGNNFQKIVHPDLAQLLKVLILAEMNIVLAGRTGTGKTELQKMLVQFIPNNKKILLIEDTMDSHIKQVYPDKDVFSWRTLMDDARDKKIGYNDLIKAGLRNNPDWIIIAETRGAEAYDMLESALTDHSIITTIHAKEAKSIPSRLIKMIGQKYQANEILLGKDIVNTLRFAIYLNMEFTDKGIQRYIKEIVEFTGFNENGVKYIPLYRVNKIYDSQTKKYHKEIRFNPLSKQTRIELENKQLIHLVPDIFLNSQKETE